jgi:hypothetical protein
MTAGRRKGLLLTVTVAVLVAPALGVLWYSKVPHGAQSGPAPSRSEMTSVPSRFVGPDSPSAPPAGEPVDADRGDAGAGGEAPAAGVSGVRPRGAQPPRFFGPQTAADYERTRECGQQVRQLAQAVLMYGTDYDDHLPLADTWCDGTYPYVRSDELYRCPAAREKYGYAFNRNLSYARTRDITDWANVVMLFESSVGKKNASDTGQSICTPPRHQYGNNVGYLDGHFALSGQLSRSAFRWR